MVLIRIISNIRSKVRFLTCFSLHIQEPKGRIWKLVETNGLTVSDSGEIDQISF